MAAENSESAARHGANDDEQRARARQGDVAVPTFVPTPYETRILGWVDAEGGSTKAHRRIAGGVVRVAEAASEGQMPLEAPFWVPGLACTGGHLGVGRY